MVNGCVRNQLNDPNRTLNGKQKNVSLVLQTEIQTASYLAYSIVRVSRMTVTLISPG